MQKILLLVAFAVLVGAEILKVYFIMPFPGSQVEDRVALAYFLESNIYWIRIGGFMLLGYSLVAAWGKMGASFKIITGILVAFYLFVSILFNFYFLADKIFYQPNHTIFYTAAKSTVSTRQLVIGVAIKGEARAYPIEIIGYHHQVRDTIGGELVMITYCTVCRTGRVFSPVVDGRAEEFRLVGMDHFNAMFEDKTTKSWWRQVNGEAVVGPARGKRLTEIPCWQGSLRSWLEQYPDSKIMQPDSSFKLGYADLKLYDEGTLPSHLERRDTLSWRDKSWIVGVQLNGAARAYDWNDLVGQRVINDTLAGTALVAVVEGDSASFHVFKRDSLQFIYDGQAGKLKDVNTGSYWSWRGVCTTGLLVGKKLLPVQSYQEFWHSWKTFRPKTTQFNFIEKK